MSLTRDDLLCMDGQMATVTIGRAMVDRVTGEVCVIGGQVWLLNNERNGFSLPDRSDYRGYTKSWELQRGVGDWCDAERAYVEVVTGKTYVCDSAEYLGERVVLGVDGNRVFFTNAIYRKRIGFTPHDKIYQTDRTSFRNWKLKPTVKEMTVAEASKALGYEIKIIK